MTMPMGNGCVNGSPNVGNGNNVRNINPSGNVNNSHACNSLGVAPACTINLASLESAPTGA